ncbi:MAG: SDR family NAD(P)-dependent oxidoreductase [Thermoplasmatales archaeon]|nr:SDR family NAD(P)-dependent oxidoreductase [Thermoplasmatales archaeon]
MTVNRERFRGKGAVVTGGSRGIGRSLALGLAREGANVCISYLSHPDEAASIVREMKDLGVEAFSYKIDQSDISQVEGFANYAIEKLGKVHALVNNAGICPFRGYFDIDPPLFEKVWKVNVESHFFITQKITSHMIDEKLKGRVLMISSISSHVGGEFQTHYTPTKSALNGLVHSLSIVLGKHGILVNSLEPGTILTDINKEDLANLEKRSYMEKRISIGRLGTPDDMVGPALFLLSEENSYSTGSELLADGGMLVNLQ